MQEPIESNLFCQDPSRPDLAGLLAKWQAILRLQDWNVKISYARPYQMGANREGECEFITKKKNGIIRVLDPNDYPGDIEWPQHIEQTVVHELLHFHFALIDKFDGTDYSLFEQMIDSLSGTLVKLDRAARGEMA